MRIILFTGKGGVGKTSVAAATACKLARQGKKVFIMSTDQAHSLSDCFDIKIGNEPMELMKGLYGLEIDTVRETEESWGIFKEYLLKLMATTKLSDLEAEEMLTFPGMDEIFSLLKIKEIYDADQYDVCIVDCAPTGETLSLLKFPEMLEWWMLKLFPAKRKVIKAIGPVVEKTTKIPMPKEEVFDEIEGLLQKITNLRTLLGNQDIVSIRIVTTPEKIVIREAKRNFSFLHLYNYNVDAVVVNKIYPKQSMQGYFQQWELIQQEALQDIQESFTDIPCFYLELQNSEIRTVDCLEQVGDLLYGEEAPDQVFFRDTVFEINKIEGLGYVMEIHLPFTDKSEVDVQQIGDEIVLSVKNEHRRFVLPPKLLGKEIARAKYEDDRLKLYFRQNV